MNRCKCGNPNVRLLTQNWAWGTDVGGAWFAKASCRKCGRSVGNTERPLVTERKARDNALARLRKVPEPKTT